MRYITLTILAIGVSACGHELVEVASVCQAIVSGEPTDLTLDGAERSTVRVTPVNCTGVLIAPTVVLTAAHCGNPAWVEAGGVVRSTIMYVPHPQYQPGVWVNDLALVFLDGTILGMEPATIGWPRKGEATVQGYGFNESGAGSAGVLREGIATIDRFYDEHKFSTNNIGADTCYGDSGGPVYQRGLLVGVSSSALAQDAECGDGALYTIPSLFQEWIESEVIEVSFSGKCG